MQGVGASALPEGIVSVCFQFRKYPIYIGLCRFLHKLLVFPARYAAVAESLPDFKGMHMVADIGNGTMNVMILNNGKASESKSWTVKLGANECFMEIRNLILDRKAGVRI